MTTEYDIYGMGNALVDIEFNLSDDDLKRLGIDKGVMTLVEHSRMLELLDALKDIPSNRTSGGSAANTIMTSQLLGNKTYYSCKVANDEPGDLFLEQLKSQGVDTNLTQDNREAGITGECIVKITPDSERTMCTHLGITNTYSENEMDFEALKTSQVLYIEGYLSAQGDATKAAIKAKKTAEFHHTLTSVTLSDPNIVSLFKNNLLDIIGAGVDILFCNEHEAKMFCDTDDLSTALCQLKNYSRTFAVTLGSKGACVFDGNTLTEIPGKDVTVINTVGAGDVFAGAFLYAITRGYDHIAATELANIAAAEIVTKIGPRINAEDAQKILKTFEG